MRNQRKDMGDIPTSEVVAPERNGDRAVVMMKVEVMVEVAASDDWNDMVEQAKDDLNRRIVESNTFYPVGARCETIFTPMRVQDLKYRTYVDGRGQW